MFTEILDLAISNGLWATLFVALLLYVLKDTSSREKKYQITIDSLSSHLSVVKEIKREVEEINSKVKPKQAKGVKLNATQLKEQD